DPRTAAVTAAATVAGTSPAVTAGRAVTYQPVMSAAFAPAPPATAAVGTQVALQVTVNQDGAVPTAQQQVDFVVDQGTLSAANCTTGAATGSCSVNVTLNAA